MVGHVSLSQVAEIGLKLAEGQRKELLIFKSESDSLNEARQGNHILFVTDFCPPELVA